MKSGLAAIAILILLWPGPVKSVNFEKPLPNLSFGDSVKIWCFAGHRRLSRVPERSGNVAQQMYGGDSEWVGRCWRHARWRLRRWWQSRGTRVGFRCAKDLG